MTIDDEGKAGRVSALALVAGVLLAMLALPLCYWLAQAALAGIEAMGVPW